MPAGGYGIPWSSKEIRVLKKYFPDKCKSWKELKKSLPKRSQGAIEQFARKRLKLERNKKIKYKHLKLVSEKIDDDLGWSIYQVINSCGNLLGCGFFLFENNEMKRNYQRQHYLSTYDENGKAIQFKNLQKRKRSNECELCQREVSHLIYHHWGNPEVGLWICGKCHYIVECYEKMKKKEIKKKIKYYKYMKKLVEENKI